MDFDSIRIDPWWAAFFGWMCLASVVAFITHAWDKHCARHDRSRVPERRLHLLEAIGGWPGAVLAMMLLRHKVRKTSYLAVTAFIIVLWSVAIIWRFRSGGLGLGD
ncbi:MAG: DUF1294 domain-containing protein [Planctomycetota bacterium]|jgi:uncharacterized membrane protein YsdA (DUF1294 family)|nr:DUF1294 domain-containing protein [Planctomycetota bacterium]MDA1025348.1 DUF1294 domain-containing protein [Planctomycetota bacterium]